MKNIIGLKDLRENMNAYAGRVESGESFVVMKKSKPLFTMSPIESEELWEPVIDFMKIKKGGVNIKDILAKL